MTQHPLPGIASHVVLTEEQIAVRVSELGRQLCADLAGPITLVTVLKGGLFFLVDLARCMDADVKVDFLSVVAYGPGSPGSVRVTKDLDHDVQDSTVVLVEDVVDTGLTVNYIMRLLSQHSPRRLVLCTLLDKPARRIARVDIDYTGFVVHDDFLMGYGLDVGGRYRNLPYIAAVRPEVLLDQLS